MSPITGCLVQFSIGIMCIIVFVHLFAFFHKNLAALLLVGKHYGHSTHWLLVKLIDWDHVHYCVCLSVLFLFVSFVFPQKCRGTVGGWWVCPPHTGSSLQISIGIMNFSIAITCIGMKWCCRFFCFDKSNKRNQRQKKLTTNKSDKNTCIAGIHIGFSSSHQLSSSHKSASAWKKHKHLRLKKQFTISKLTFFSTWKMGSSKYASTHSIPSTHSAQVYLSQQVIVKFPLIRIALSMFYSF